jgi:hypothetical protein
MGRPLNKKFFGNRNIGRNGSRAINPLHNSQNASDDAIGGEGILSITAAAEKGDVLINSSYPAPILVKPAPKIPGGVASTSRVIWEVDRIALVSGGSNYETTGFPISITFTGLGGGVVAKMTANNAGAATTAGINGTDQANWSLTGASRGEFIDTPPTENLTYEVCSPVNITGGGDNAQCQVFFRVKRIEVLTQGSGYTGTETFSWNTAGCSGTPFPGAPTFAKTVDTGLVGSATNQENAIVIHANTDDAGAKIGDIIRQVNSRSYKVKTADGTAVCKLVADDTPAFGKAFIIATDDNGNTYFVTKLTAHKARLERFTNNEEDWLFANGESARWTFGNAQAGDRKSVQIENA